MKKRFFGLALALVLCLGLFPAQALAAEDEEADNPSDQPAVSVFAGGAGTEDNPYLISSLSELEALRDSVIGGETYEGKNIELTADIDMSEKYGEGKASWDPIGTEQKKFMAVFDGGGHTITGIYINSDKSYMGLFGWVEKGGIKNLTMKDGTVITTDGLAGAVVGIINGWIVNCHNESVNVTSRMFAGGIAGQVDTQSINPPVTPEETDSYVENCSNTGNIVATGSGKSGGIVGVISAARISNCLNTGNISNGTAGFYSGGIVGPNNQGIVSNCLSIAEINPTTEQYSDFAGGGICGQARTLEIAQQITNCFYLSNLSIGIGNLSSELPGTRKLSEGELASGEIAYLLQQGQSEQVWGQMLSGNAQYATPILSTDIGKRVLKVTFITNNSEPDTIKYMNYNSLLAKPGDPALENYFFGGWYTDAGCTTAYDFSTPVTKGLTLYAKWNTSPVEPDPPPVTPDRPSSSDNTPTTYRPDVSQPDHGSVTVSPRNPQAGDKVTVKPVPDEGYEVDSVTITDRKGRPVAVTEHQDGTYSFTQPQGTVTIEVELVPLAAAPWTNPYTDVTEGRWYSEAVRFVTENGLMSGYDNQFAPGAFLTRAQLAQVLYNCAERPATETVGSFDDVRSGAWYSQSVAWAVERGVVSGYGGGRFGPNDPITREQLAAMLWQYAGRPEFSELALPFQDTDQVSPWAADALRWAVDRGILSGRGGGVLDPTGYATRAEAAQMLKVFLEQQV